MWLLTPTEADGHAAAADQARSLARLGVSAEALAATATGATQPDAAPFTSWAWHLDAMRLFGAMRTQWRVVPAVAGLVYLGLEYGGLATVKRELGFKGVNRVLFDQFQALERGGTIYLNGNSETRA